MQPTRSQSTPTSDKTAASSQDLNYTNVTYHIHSNDAYHGIDLDIAPIFYRGV